MGLVSRSGTRSNKATPIVPAKETNRVLAPDNLLEAKDRDIDKLTRIEDTFTTKHSVNPVSYPEEFRMLMAYPKGTPVLVTYFFQNLPDIDHLSAMSDMSLVEHHGHKDLTEVRKMEVRFLDQIQHEFREEDNSWSITVEALVYPGREPHMGDVFLFEVGNNKIIEFQVNNVRPTTYRQGSYYQVSANSYRFATSESVELLRNCVTDVYYFDKDKYFDDGRVTVLKHQSYIDLRKLEHLRKELIEVYMNKFYREDFESVAYIDNTYDPYLVEYLKNKISLSDYHRRPEQLDTSLHDYEKSIWYKLANSVCPDVLDDTCIGTSLQYNEANALSPTNNRLDNSFKIILDTSSTLANLTNKAGILTNNRRYGSNNTPKNTKPYGKGGVLGPNGYFKESTSNNKYLTTNSSSIDSDCCTRHKSQCSHINNCNGLFISQSKQRLDYLINKKGSSSNITLEELQELLKLQKEDMNSYLNNSPCSTCKESCCSLSNSYNSSSLNNSNNSSTTKDNTYAFSLSFYSGDTENMSDYEKLVYNYLKRNTINIQEALSTLQNYRKMSIQEKYYIIPAFISVIDYLILELR